MKQKILLTSSSYVTTRPSKQAWRLSLLRNFILTLLLTVAQGAWADWNGETYTASSDENPTGTINVSTATLTIQSGVTVTVTGSIVITGTLTVTGGGTLAVHAYDGDEGSNGDNAIVGNVIINGANVEASGGDGGNGDPGYKGEDEYFDPVLQETIPAEDGWDGNNGGHGGAAFTGQVTIFGGSITATGGNGGKGGDGGDGGDGVEKDGGNGGKGGDAGKGGNAFSGTLIFYGGTVTASGGDYDEYGYGGSGGNGGTNGNKGSDGENGDYGYFGYAFSNDVDFKTGYYTMKGDDFENPDDEIDADQASWYRYVTITASDAVASGNCGATGHESEVMWVLTGTSPNCTLTISGTGAMADFADASAQTWAAYRASIKTVTINKDITSISSYAFDGCTNLTSVTINSNPTIGTDAFSSASVTMYLTANEGATGEYWTTFNNENYSFEADEDTQLFKAALSGTSLTLTELTTDKIVTNGNAVILKSTASPIVMTLTTAGSNDFSGNSLQGVSDPEGLTADDPSTTYVLNKKSSGVGFYKLKAGKTAGVGKAYLTYSGGGASAREFFGFSETTSVDEVRSTKEDAPGNVFDLQGCRVSQPTKGLYIVRSAAERSQGKNGKKVFINK